jgi:hypothetical protein
MNVTVTRITNKQEFKGGMMNSTKLNILLNDIESLMDALEELHQDLVDMNLEMEHNLSEIE